jgi:probable biosynthetic protein (TIGR04098 family)
MVFMSLTRPTVSELFALELGMPHLGRSGLNESALLKAIGHDRWMMLEQIGGVRTSDIRDAFDNRLYATYCFVELNLSPERPLSAYDENHLLRFSRNLSHYGRVYLDGAYSLVDGGPFTMRCTNVFIYQLAGPQQLKMAQPENCDFDAITELESQPESLDFCRAAKEAGTFRPLDDGGIDLGRMDVQYQLDPDRDANGAGLIYFANFVCFLDFAERTILNHHRAPQTFIDARSTFWRRMGYFGNAPVTDRLNITIRAKVYSQADRAVLGFDYRIRRESDGKLILVSSSRKSATLDDAGHAWMKSLPTSGSANG